MDLILCRGLKQPQNMAINLLLIIHCGYLTLVANCLECFRYLDLT